MHSRILIVDDDGLARQVYGDCLAEAGHETVAVRDAVEAAEALEAGPFDVVVSDLVLPGADGLAVLADAKRRDPGIEVILITAVDRVDPAVQAMKSGAADYLVKPVSPESLQLSVARCLATRQLLQENAVLRQHLSLVEAGQRLATTLDREKLYPMALRALVDALGAQASALLARRAGGELALVAHAGLGATEAEALAAEPLAALAQHGQAASTHLAGRDWRLLYVEDAGYVHAVCLLADPSPVAMAWANAQFLCRHLAIALQNVRRLSEVEDLIYQDDLTRLHNVRWLHVALDREITNSKQTGQPFSLLFLDLDHFKKVNDTHGHLAGSKLLVELAGMLRTSIRDIDTAVRYGGDEYVVVLRHTDTGGALKVAERIRRTVEAHRFLTAENLGLTLTVCIGVASYPEHARDKLAVLDCADRAMYRGKQSTRNVIYVASPPPSG